MGKKVRHKVLSGGRDEGLGYNEFELGKPFSRKNKSLGSFPSAPDYEAKIARKVLSFFTNRANKSLMEALKHLLSELARFELFYGRDVVQPEAGKIADEFAKQGEFFLSQLCSEKNIGVIRKKDEE